MPIRRVPTWSPWLFLLLLGAGCGESPGGKAASPAAPRWPSAEARTLQEGHAPTPFTAPQIRDGCRSGRVATFRVESEAQGDGLLVFRYDDADEEGVTLTISFLDAARRPKSEPDSSRRTWEALQSNASFPAGSTRIRDEVVDVPGGASPASSTRCAIPGPRSCVGTTSPARSPACPSA